MKHLFIGAFLLTGLISACNNSNTREENKDTTKVVTNAPLESAASNSNTGSIKGIVDGYLQLKNALTKDNAKDAATAGTAIVAALTKVTPSSFPADKQKAYSDLQDDIKENAEHIGANADKIDHQREHFVMLSKDIADLVKAFGSSGQTLYKDFCPMANEGKGAVWISETKEIKNPYLGSKMPTCGSLKETIQ